MAPSRRRAAAEEEEVQEEAAENVGEFATLSFDEELTWRPGKPIQTSVLLGRLERLFKELADLEQETTDVDSLRGVADALAQRNLLQHKDRGIKAYVACCVVEILRICAPEPMLTDDQTKTFFNLVINHVLPALQDPTNPYNSQHKHVLVSLSEVKSILLLNEAVERADEMIVRLFNVVFDGVSSSRSSTDEQMARDVENHMADLLLVLVDEGPGISTDMIDVILAQFLRAAPPGGRARGEQHGTQSTLLPKTEPPAYSMARKICSTYSEKMSRYVSQYFSEVILNSSKFAIKQNGHRATDYDDDDDDDEPTTGPTEGDMKTLNQAHLLIRELWRASPSVLSNVVPHVEAELSADNIHLRQIATETFGDMISGIGAAGAPPPPTLDPCAYPPLKFMDEPASQVSPEITLTTPYSPLSFAHTHPQAYHSFLGRRNDKAPTIRAAWVIAAGHILATSAGGIGLSREEEEDLVKSLGDRLDDADEKVRLAAIKAIELLDIRDIVLKLGPYGGIDKPGSILAKLADRCRDRRPAVRVDGMVLIGKLWAAATGEIADGNQAVISCLSDMPSSILNSFYAQDNDVIVLVDRVLFDCLVPLNYPPAKAKGSKAGASQSQTSGTSGTSNDPDRIRAHRILLLVKSLNPRARKAFYAMQMRRPQFARLLEQFIQLCEAYNGGTTGKDGEVITKRLGGAIKYISQTLLPDAAKANVDLHKFAKANDRRNYQLIKFAIGSDNDYKTVKGGVKEFIKRIQSTSMSSTLDTLVPLLYRTACLMYNKSHLSTIMDYSRSDDGGLGGVAHDILNDISNHNPDLFKSYVGELCKDLTDHAPTERKTNDAGVVDILKACSSYSRKSPGDIPGDKAFVQTLSSYALHGSPPRAAKYAVNLMMAGKTEKSMVAATSLLRKIMQGWDLGSANFLNKLVAVSQLELLAPKVTLDHDDEIRDMTVQKILLQARTAERDDDADWVEDGDADDEITAKCLALKVLANRLRAVDDEEQAKEKAKPVFKLLLQLIGRGGEICKSKNTPKHHRSRLRLRAAQLLLKLCTLPQLAEQLDPQGFDKLALVTQDPSSEVRSGFISKLQKYLSKRRLRPRFYTIVFLTAFEPMTELKDRVETVIRALVRSFEPDNHVMEATMPRLLSLLAHHPDYGTELNELVDHAKYILYYVSNVATPANCGLIYKYAERVKQTRDAVEKDKTRNLYMLSDLAMTVIRKWQERRGWSFLAWPKKVGLPVGLYAPLDSHDQAQQIAEKQFLPDDIDEKIDELIRSADRKKKRKSMDDRHDPPAKKARPSAARPSAKESSARKPKAARPAGAKKTKKASAAAAAVKRRRNVDVGDSPGERRRSGRATNKPKYAEDSDDDNGEDAAEDDVDMEEEEEEEDDDDDDGSEQDGAEGAEEVADSDDELSEPESEPEQEKEQEQEQEQEQEPEREPEREPEPVPAKAVRKAAVRTKPAPKAPAASSRPTRSRRGRAAAAADDYDMDEDD